MTPIKEILQIDWVSVIVAIFAVMFGVKTAFDIIIGFLSYIGKPVRWIKKNNTDHEVLQKTVKDVSDMKKQLDESVEQSIIHDNRIKDSVNNLTVKVDDLATVIDLMRKEQDSDKLAEYKDKIGQSYRYYAERKYSNENPIPYWNHMEKEALEDLIKAYESHGGKNSFVHSVVEKEMGTWKVVQNDFRK